MKLCRQRHIVGEAAVAGQQPGILDALDLAAAAKPSNARGVV